MDSPQMNPGSPLATVERCALPEQFLTADDVAELLSVHRNYIYDLASKGEMPSYKIGGNRRFKWSEINTWLEGQRQQPYGDTAAVGNITQLREASAWRM